MTETTSNKAKVLVIDDVAENIHAIMNILRDKYAVIAATNGEKGLALAAQKPQPELILLDIKMVGMDGYEVLRRLKDNPVTAEIPVIFVTALSDSEDEAKGLRMGAVDYISKPINPELLKTRVMAQLELLRYRRKAVPPGKAFNGVSLASLRILVVDDVPENVHELISALSKEFRIIAATNGAQALAIVQGENPPDLILLDILMPEMDGYETCRHIKATPTGRRIPIIFLSVLDNPFEKVRGFSLGAADYITKPFDIDEARARIHTHLQLSQLQLRFELQVEQRTADLQEATNQLRLLNMSLDERVAKRTAELLVKNTELERSEAALQIALAEKQVLLREVHHRVKNNMAAISALLDMQRQSMHDPHVETALKELESRVRAMSLVHENLYKSESLARIDFQNYLESLVLHLRTSFYQEGVNSEITAQEIEIPLDLAVPCGMIINELVINAFKYAFPKERLKPNQEVDRIQVAMSHANDTFSLSVADNGVGLPPGFDLQTVESLGLTLVRMLGEHQLGGCYQVDQTCGTRFSLTFKDRKAERTNE